MFWRIQIAAIALLAAGAAIGTPIGLWGLPPAQPRPDAEAEIRAVLSAQVEAWNRGDVAAFMQGYWKSDSTEFVSARGVTQGWQALFDRYRQVYPDQKAMGQLSFANLQIHAVCADAAYAVGEFRLVREKDQPAGVFTLYFRKFDMGWRIVVDHTTAFPAPAAPQG